MKELLEGCRPEGSIGREIEDYSLTSVGETSLRARLTKVVNNLITLGAILSIGNIVFCGMIFVVYGGDEERTKQARRVILWSILGFIGMITAYPIVNAVINFVFSVGSGS
ncbi:hypothetical protein [Sulfidibacter corallicola]|uniref:Uncharacterized protein n=1 Tax=Sulfidibacter corallicola TaxID=2818388 RepID=A0A8A4TMF7_SULCO|nr:hypothetical protein [Sulfidibacter corallicola]QTD50733.1 hypothetical protein J3U87_34540 [Sulfidibacter corallicola]